MREKSKLRAIEKKIGKKFEKRQVPSGREICETQLFNLIDKFEQVEVNEKQIEPFLDVIYQKLSSLDREELIKRFVSVEFNQFLEYYKNARDLNAVDRNEPYDRDRNNKSFERGDRERDRNRDRGRGRDRDKFRDREDNGRGYSERNSRSEDSSDRRKSYADIEFSRFFINKGSKDDLNPVALIGLINKYSKERGIEIGKIEIMKSFSFFEIDRNFESKLMNNFQDAVFDNSPVMLEVANSKGGGFREEGEIKRKKKSLAAKRSDSFRPATKSKRSDSAKPYDKGKRRSRKS